MALNTAHVCLVCEPSLSGSCRLKKSVRGEVIRVLHPKHVIQDSSRVKEELKASFVLMECTHTDTQGQTHECVKTYECQKSTRAVGKCSAFAGNAVLEEAPLMFLSPIDPLFIMLPLLFKASQKANSGTGVYARVCDMTSMFTQDTQLQKHYSAIAALDDVDKRLELLCDLKEYDCWKTYRLSEDKLCLFLQKKMEKMLQHSKKHRVYPSEATIISRVSDSCNTKFNADRIIWDEEHTVDTDAMRLVCWEIISTYIPANIEATMKEKLQVKEAAGVKKSGKRPSHACETTTDYVPQTQSKMQKTSSAARKPVSKDVKSSGNIMTFFNSKPPKK